MKRQVIAVGLACGLLVSPAAAEQETPDEVARDGIEKLMRAMELFLGSIPLYEAPEVMPNGDIIIRRVPPADSGKRRETAPEQERRHQTPPKDDRA